MSQMQTEAGYSGPTHKIYAPPWDKSGNMVATKKSAMTVEPSSSAAAPFKIRRWDEIDEDEDNDGGHGYAPEHVDGNLLSYGLDMPQFATQASPRSYGPLEEDDLIREIERLDPNVKVTPPRFRQSPKPEAVDVQPVKEKEDEEQQSSPVPAPKSTATLAAAAKPKKAGGLGGLMKGKWKAAVAKVMSGDDVRKEWQKIREKELKEKGPKSISSLREATMELLKRERENTTIPTPPPPEAIQHGNQIAKSFAAAVKAEIEAEVRLVRAEDLAEDNAVEFRDAGEAAAESYGRLIARFRWQIIALGLAAVAGVCYLCGAGPAVAASAHPPSTLPSSDFATVFHKAAALGAGPLTLTTRGDAVRVRLAFGVEPRGNGALIGDGSTTTGSGGGESGGGALGAMGRVSVGAACAAAACDGADALAATAAGGGGNVTATSCWIRDVREYVNTLHAASASVRDECDGGVSTTAAAALGAWENITGCPATCNCRPGGQARSKAGCAAAVESQERAFWRAVRAYAASSSDNNDRLRDGLLRPSSAHASSAPVNTCAGAATDAALAGAGHVTAAEIHLTATWRTLPRTAALSLADTWRNFWSNLWILHPTDFGEYEDTITAGGKPLRVEKRAPRVLKPRDGNVTECAAVAGVYGGVQISPAHQAWTWRGISGWAWVDWVRNGFWDVVFPSIAAVGAATLLPVGAMTRSSGLTAAAVLAGIAALAFAAAPGMLGLDHSRSGVGAGSDAPSDDEEVSLPTIASLLAVPAVAAPWLVHLSASYMEAMASERAEAALGKRKRYRLLPWRLRARRRDRMRRRCTCAMLRDAGLVVAQSSAAAIAAAGAVAAVVPSGTFIGQLAAHQLGACAGAALAALLVFPALTAVLGPTFEPPTRPRSPLEIVGANVWKDQLLSGNGKMKTSRSGSGMDDNVGGSLYDTSDSDDDGNDALDAVKPFAAASASASAEGGKTKTTRTPKKKKPTHPAKKVFKRGVGYVDEEPGQHGLSPRERWMQKKIEAKERAKAAKKQQEKFAPMAVMEGFAGEADFNIADAV